MPNMITEFPDYQQEYDAMMEFNATNIEEPDDSEELEERMCEVTDSTDFPTESECKAVGLSHNKYVELVRLVAQRQIDRERFGFAS